MRSALHDWTQLVALAWLPTQHEVTLEASAVQALQDVDEALKRSILLEGTGTIAANAPTSQHNSITRQYKPAER